MSTDEVEAVPEVEAVVLPGERIRKYRDPAEVAAEDAVRRQTMPVFETAAASVPAVEIVGWDGGAVLPGETLSRHRGREAGAQESRRDGGRSASAADGRRDGGRNASATDGQRDGGRGRRGDSRSASLQPMDLKVYATGAALTPVVVQELAGVDENVAPTPIPDVEEIAAAAVPEETGGLTQHPAHADEGAAVGPVVEMSAAGAAEPEIAAASAVAAESVVATKPVVSAVPAEYEPAEGDAASLGDAGRREYRRLERKPEEVAPAADTETLAAEPDATTYDLQSRGAEVQGSTVLPDETFPNAVPLDLGTEPATLEAERAAGDASEFAVEGEAGHEFTVVSGDGAMVSETVLVNDEVHLPAAQDADEPVDVEIEPVAAEAAMQSGVLLEHHEVRPIRFDAGFDAGLEEPKDVLTPEDEEPMHDGALVAEPFAGPLAGPLPETGETPVPQVHAYGDGDLEEEEVDGDEFEFDLAVASVEEDEFEDYEEETLDGTDGLDAVMEEMSLENDGGEDGEEEAGEAFEEEPAYQAESAAGGFTVEDFGGEPAEVAESTAGTGERRPRREGGRDGRRGGRDRERRPGGGFRGGASAAASGDRDRGRGRGRQSVQTMDLPAINELLKPGQEVLLQIAKEPIAKKGARVTSHIALPGRFLVFMPTVNHTGVSRKISSDEERRRLKTILLSEKGDAQGGFIVRTAADGASEEELRNDLRFLIQLWQDIKARSESSKAPALIYHDLSLIERILRDQVTDNFSAIWVDTEAEYERVLRFLQRFQPSLVRRVKLYTKETPLFEHFGVTPEIDKALKSKVWLKSGGSIVIDQTEALVAIDINTGKYVGKTARLEDTILKTNLDAIPEIVRQIRLRDLGGIIVIDFIDMDDRRNRARVMQVLEEELKSDRAPSKVLPFNDFGLVIMTRKRVKQSLERTLCIPDPITDGTGMIKSPITVANEIYIEMRKMQRHFEKPDVLLRVNPEVVKTLKANGGKRLQELEEMTRKTILVKSDPAISPEQFDIH